MEAQGEVASAPGWSRSFREAPRAGWDPYFNPAFDEGVTVEKMRREGSGLVEVCLFFSFLSPLLLGGVGAGLVR